MVRGPSISQWESRMVCTDQWDSSKSMLLLYISGQWLVYQSSHPESTIEVIRATKLTTTVNDDKAKCSWWRRRRGQILFWPAMSWRGPKYWKVFFGASPFRIRLSDFRIVRRSSVPEQELKMVCPKPVLQRLQVHLLPLYLCFFNLNFKEAPPKQPL